MDESGRGFYKRTVNPAKFSARLRNIDWFQPSAIAIIAGNLVPLVAVFIFHWDVFSLVFLFWLENIVVGVINVFKILLAGVGAKDLSPFGSMITVGMKAVGIPFFCMHYGVFTLMQGVFVVGFLTTAGRMVPVRSPRRIFLKLFATIIWNGLWPRSLRVI